MGRQKKDENNKKKKDPVPPAHPNPSEAVKNITFHSSAGAGGIAGGGGFIKDIPKHLEKRGLAEPQPRHRGVHDASPWPGDGPQARGNAASLSAADLERQAAALRRITRTFNADTASLMAQQDPGFDAWRSAGMSIDEMSRVIRDFSRIAPTDPCPDGCIIDRDRRFFDADTNEVWASCETCDRQFRMPRHPETDLVFAVEQRTAKLLAHTGEYTVEQFEALAKMEAELRTQRERLEATESLITMIRQRMSARMMECLPD